MDFRLLILKHQSYDMKKILLVVFRTAERKRNDFDLVLFWIPWSLSVQADLMMSGTQKY